MSDALANIAGGDRDSKYRARSSRWGGISENLMRAHVMREKPPIPAPVEAPPIAAPTFENPCAGSSVGRLIASYDDVVDVLRARADELELSRLELDRLSGLADGHSSHLLAKKYSQRLGPVSLLLMLDVLGLRFLVVEDPALTARTLQRRTPRKSSHLRVAPRSVPTANAGNSAASSKAPLADECHAN